MVRTTIFAAALLALSPAATRADDIDDTKLIDLWARQRSVCDEGDEKSPDTWIACGRSDAFAAVLAARGLCLDAGQDVWRVGNHTSATSADDHWRCSLVSS